MSANVQHSLRNQATLFVEIAEFVAVPFIRHCVECRKCLTRYLIAFSPYGNGSYLWRQGLSSSDEYLLYCFCQQPPVFSRWKEHEVKTYVVSRAAHARGYGTSDEIIALEHDVACTLRSN